MKLIKKMREKRWFLKSRVSLLLTMLFLFVSRVQAYAGDGDEGGNTAASAFAGTKLVTGTTKLIKDVTNVALVLIPSIGVIVGVYFWVRKGAADEQDQKTWQKRINTDIMCVIGAVVFTGLIKTIVSYYN